MSPEDINDLEQQNESHKAEAPLGTLTTDLTDFKKSLQSPNVKIGRDFTDAPYREEIVSFFKALDS